MGLAEAQRIALSSFGLTGTLQELPSERDRNFLLTTPSDERFVLKIAHAGDGPALLDLQHRSLERIAERAPAVAVPRVVRSSYGREIETVDGGDGTSHLARVLTWVPGHAWAEIRHHPPELLLSLGAAMGAIDRALEGFEHAAARRELKWDLTRPLWVLEHLDRVEDPRRRALVERHLRHFQDEVLPVLPELRRGVIHNDANDWNVIVDGGLGGRRVVGIVDFGDMVESAVVCDLAIACAYAILGKPDPLSAASDVVAGYHEAYPLLEAELAVLYPLICTRLSVSVVNAAYQRSAFPEDSYLTISEGPAWTALERLEGIHRRLAHYTFRAAAGLEPCPGSTAVIGWLERHRNELGPLLELSGGSGIEVLDLSVGSPLNETPVEMDDLPLYTRKLFDRIHAAGARVGIGRYDEARLFYATDAFATEGNDRPVPRTVHIGLDLFVEPGTAVRAPLDGVVESVRDNAAPRDYGPTVILRHAVGMKGEAATTTVALPPRGGRVATLPRGDGEKGENGEKSGVFYTLFGHLGRECLTRLRSGELIRRGERVGVIGDIDVNGGWPPHLHFQLITDLLDRDGEFPGVARADQRAVWKSLSPDPNLVAQLPAKLLAAPHRKGVEVLQRRRRLIGPSLSVAYRRPLTIVRGWKQFLYDENGLAYLDAVNNVAHVGHSHPAVVRAAREQMAVLNTNTRYLHELLVEYAERLTATLPGPLRICYFVNSGSEANELAIRMARAATGRCGMVVVDVGYHGNTTTLVDVSPYKHDGPGGAGPPPWVRKIPMPDVYRGAWRRDDRDAGGKYGAAVSDAIAELAANSQQPAAFLCESVLSCGGQIVLPDGFLAEAYRRMRAAGGVCIADEVQVGFGRVGTHFWAFEAQGVVPDIVTLGKPIGNGHPLGAVITTPEIAQAFANGMEFFSSFGGNPVSCAVGLAVLQVLEAEGLQQNALRVGAHLLGGLRGLVERHPIAGDARGLGLFLGLELVRNRETLEPATEEARYVTNRMRDRGVLLSTDGPFANVLKIKPPMCFTADDADRLVELLGDTLTELEPFS